MKWPLYIDTFDAFKDIRVHSGIQLVFYERGNNRFHSILHVNVSYSKYQKIRYAFYLCQRLMFKFSFKAVKFSQQKFEGPNPNLDFLNLNFSLILKLYANVHRKGFFVKYASINKNV